MATTETTSVKYKTTGEKLLFWVDLAMMVLIIFNLIFIIFDWSFTHQVFRNFLSQVFPPFYEYYATQIHPNFLRYDIYFVAIFVAELLIRWAVALKNKTYGAWFLYPVVHWYDVLGCIPLGVFRWLRLLRIFSISMRLHRLGIINLRETYLWRKVDQVYQIFLEEITDRVLVSFLDGIKREIIKESTSDSNIIADVVKPHRDSLSKWIAQRIQTVTETNYEAFRDDLKDQIETTVRDGFASSKGMKRVESIPLVGKQIFNSLEDTISDITFELIESSAKNVSSEKNTRLMEEGIKSIFDSILSEKKNDEVNEIVKDICVQTIDRVKADIQTKSWLLAKKEEEELGDLNDLLRHPPQKP
ncbi:MAG: hypothetical protein V4615_13460 [Bacteroidota bacterium]